MSSHALFDSSTLSLLMIIKQMQTVAMTVVDTIIQAKHVFIYLFSIMSLRPAGVCVLSVVPRCFDMQSMDSWLSCMFAVVAGPSVCRQ